MLTEPSFVEEFDTVVDEVTDQYLGNELSDGERQAFEQNYLSTSEGQQKIRFATELLDRATAERGAAVAKPVVVEAGLLASIRAFWQSQSMRGAITAAAVVIIAVGAFLIWRSINSRPEHYAVVSLSISAADRAAGAVPAKVKYESLQAGLQANLAIPESERGAKDYRVKLVGGEGPAQYLAIAERNDQTVTVKIPVANLPRGRYAFQIFRTSSDGTEQRILGSYYFDIE